jgi:prolyl-tRNA synthetase
MVLAMTHEEAVTFHASQVIKSYRDLPLCLYHFQIKERDEPRPRAGVLRTREFIMKDSYSFDRDQEGLDASYQRHREAYARIFDRCGVDWYECASDPGMMGGTSAHEYMAPCPSGENAVAFGPNGYTANVEIASADPRPAPALTGVSGELHTPGATTIEAVAAALGVDEARLLKAYPVITPERGLVMVFVRGDDTVNEIKLTNALGESFRPAKQDELPGPAGFLGPSEGVASLYDAAIVAGEYVAGANRADYHAVVDVPAGDRVDVRTVREGDSIGGIAIRIEPAIEIGNIFQLGTRYSEPLGCTYLDDAGKEHPVVMGSYGIGPARVVAAAVEQCSDEKGIAWPKSIAPWDVEVVSLGKPGSPEAAAAEELYAELRTIGLDALIDDRSSGAGEKFADAELLGCPLRLTVGKRSLESGAAEAVGRRGLTEFPGGVPLAEAAEAVQALWRQLP